MIIFYYKTKLIPLKCNKQDYLYLKKCNSLSAQVWNLCIELNNNYHNKTNKWIGLSELQKETKECVSIHAKNIQHIVHKYLQARNAVFFAQKQGRIDERYPYKQKRYFPTGWDYQAIKIDYDKGFIYLGKGKINHKKLKHVKCYTKKIPKNIVEIELIYKEKFYLAIKYKEDKAYNQITSSNSASIDLGEIHSITSIDNNGNAIIITGRKLRSIKQLRNKEQAKIRKRMSKCKRNSRQYRKYKKALNNISIKFERKINDAVHKITKLYVDYCIENNISNVYYGDLDSCTRNIKGKRSKLVTQKLNQWCYGQITLQLENKLMRYGVKLIKISEAYSSQTCPICSKLNKPKGRIYICKECGYKQHRDVVGAINLLNFNTDNNLKYYIKLKYLQIA